MEEKPNTSETRETLVANGKRGEILHWIISCHYTHADGSRVSKAIIRVCDSVHDSLCPYDKSSKPKRLKLKSPNLPQG